MLGVENDLVEWRRLRLFGAAGENDARGIVVESPEVAKGAFSFREGGAEKPGPSYGEGNDVWSVGVGAFAARNRSRRTGRNGRSIEIVARRAAMISIFKRGKPLKAAVNAGRVS